MTTQKPDIEQLAHCDEIHEICINAILRAIQNGSWKGPQPVHISGVRPNK